MPASLLAPVLPSAIARLREQRRHAATRTIGAAWWSSSRRCVPDRVELYLALLTTGGPLVPVDGPETVDKEGRAAMRPVWRHLSPQRRSCGRCCRLPLSSRSCEIKSPQPDAIVSGATRLEATVDPPSPDGADGHVLRRRPARVHGRSARRSAAPGIRAVSFAAITSAWSRRCPTAAGSIDNVRTKDLGYTEKVRTDAVLVPVIVTDGGQFVRGLKQQDFEIYEDGVHAADRQHGERGRAARSGARDRRQRQHGAFAGEVKAAVKQLLTKLRQAMRRRSSASTTRCSSLPSARRIRQTREARRGSVDVVGRHRALRRDGPIARYGQPRLGPQGHRDLLGRRRSQQPDDARDGDRARPGERRDALHDRLRRRRDGARAAQEPRELRARPPAAGRSFRGIRRSSTASSSRSCRSWPTSTCSRMRRPTRSRTTRWRNIKVQVRNGKYEIRARRGYRAPGPQRAER